LFPIAWALCWSPANAAIEEGAAEGLGVDTAEATEPWKMLADGAAGVKKDGFAGAEDPFAAWTCLGVDTAEATEPWKGMLANGAAGVKKDGFAGAEDPFAAWSCLDGKEVNPGLILGAADPEEVPVDAKPSCRRAASMRSL